MRVLITGGAGFLGSHLCEAILARGDEVVAIDNFATGRRETVKRLSENGRFSFIENDVCAAPPVPGRIDAIAHLACPASPDEYMRLPLETLSIGSHGSEFVLRLAELNHCRVLLASTSEVYGDPLERPQREEYWGNVNPIGPRSVYDESKRYAEALFMATWRVRGVNTGIVRIFNTYGPGLRPNDGRVVSSFIAQALHGDPLTIYGEGRQTRSFCYVSDLVDGEVCDPLESAARGVLGQCQSHRTAQYDESKRYAESWRLGCAGSILASSGSSTHTAPVCGRRSCGVQLHRSGTAR
jgi:dTDP-glucose 4,6-dehydratase